METKKDIYVTTKCQLWNSADEAYFYLQEGEVKKLPNKLTHVIAHGLEQGLLIEINGVDLEKAEQENRIR